MSLGKTKKKKKYEIIFQKIFNNLFNTTYINNKH